MKKGLILILGIILGVILTIVAGVIISNLGYLSDNGIEYLEKTGPVMDAQSYEVFQVLENGNALAKETLFKGMSNILNLGAVVLIVADGSSSYYDDQFITAPEGKEFRQVGTYRYQTKDEYVKTVPAIALFKK
ncbi:MAG: hypothetical protein NC115_03840 [Bacteroidales bacterium]|nr:hypothetical protein [Bacteroidales bacterium]